MLWSLALIGGSSTTRSTVPAYVSKTPRPLFNCNKLGAVRALEQLNQKLSLTMQVGAVVVGFDRRINYYKIQYACLCIRENPGCLFIATNLDAVTHLTDAQEWAGNGAMVGAIKGEKHLCMQCDKFCTLESVISGRHQRWET